MYLRADGRSLLEEPRPGPYSLLASTLGFDAKSKKFLSEVPARCPSGKFERRSERPNSFKARIKSLSPPVAAAASPFKRALAIDSPEPHRYSERQWPPLIVLFEPESVSNARQFPSEAGLGCEHVDPKKRSVKSVRIAVSFGGRQRKRFCSCN